MQDGGAVLPHRLDRAAARAWLPIGCLQQRRLGVRDLSAVYGSATHARPDHVWFAWWNGVADTDGGSYLPDNHWANHERIHQYRGSHNETWGGVTINIDNNYLDVAPPVQLGFASYAIAVDGVFGAATERAVKSFQSARGLSADGVIGARTWTALLSSGWRPVLSQGSTGYEVQRLQRSLTATLGRPSPPTAASGRPPTRLSATTSPAGG